MKKQLCILLLIFVAVVGLSSAASAVPITQGTAHGSTIRHIYTPNEYGSGYRVIRVVNTGSYGFVRSLMRQYRPPLYKVSVSTIRQPFRHVPFYRVTISNWIVG